MEQHEILINRSYGDIIIPERIINSYLSAKSSSARMRILLSLPSSAEQIALLSIAKARLDGKSFTQTEKELKVRKAKELYRAGMSYNQIAKQLNISRSTAYRYVHNY